MQEEDTYPATRVKTVGLSCTYPSFIPIIVLMLLSEISFVQSAKFGEVYHTICIIRKQKKRRFLNERKNQRAVELQVKKRMKWFLLGKYHSFLIFRVRASTINFCYQRVVFGEKKCVLCLFIYMHFWEKLSHLYMITN